MNENAYVLEIKEKLNDYERDFVLKINEENLKKNGGTLMFEGILRHKYVALAYHKGEVIAYMLLDKSFYVADDAYVMQVAVDNRFKGKGIAKQMYKYVYEHLSGYKYFTAHVNVDNEVSKKLHEDCGFTVVRDDGRRLAYCRLVGLEVNKTLNNAVPRICTFKDKNQDNDFEM